MNRPSADQIVQLGRHYRSGKTVYDVQVGQEYTVLGVGIWDGVPWFELAPSAAAILSVPAFLFEVTSGRLSKHWEARIHPDGALTLWPASFYHQHYHHHVSEGHTEALADFKYLFQLLETEAADVRS